MEEHHKRAIQHLVDIFIADPRYQACIIAGSLAQGRGKPSSDIDVLLVASDEEYAYRQSIDNFAYFNFEVCDYPGGYIDGKIINRQFLLDAADHGSEPTRAAYVGAYPAYSHIPDLKEILARIPVYPEHEREAKMRSFFAQVLLQGNYFVSEAEKRNDPYLMMHTASDLVLFGGRLILAYNHVLFPCHKSLMETLNKVDNKPDNFLELAEKVLHEPNVHNAVTFRDCITSFRDWGLSYEEAVTQYFYDIEWNWRRGKAPVEDW